VEALEPATEALDLVAFPIERPPTGRVVRGARRQCEGYGRSRTRFAALRARLKKAPLKMRVKGIFKLSPHYLHEGE
jgi:hypothetical protein